MKLLIVLCGVLVTVLADVSHLGHQYVPPPIPQFRSRLPSGSNFIPRVGAAQTHIPSFAAPRAAPAPLVVDSGTQGPSPEDIATPEPEYIDIDLPPSGPSAPALPLAPAPRSAAPVPGHTLQADGYHYRKARKFYFFRRRN